VAYTVAANPGPGVRQSQFALPLNTPIVVEVGMTQPGSTSVDGSLTQSSAGTVGALDAFNTYTVTPLTINAGDFVVGFRVAAPGLFPVSVDKLPPSQMRSYFSTNGVTYKLLDTNGSPGNFGIRATVTVAP
jgi:hypothetical protein